MRPHLKKKSENYDWNVTGTVVFCLDILDLFFDSGYLPTYKIKIACGSKPQAEKNYKNRDE